MMRYLLASPDADFERRVRHAFGGALNGDLSRMEEYASALHEAAAAGPDRPAVEVALIGPGVNADTALDVARRFDSEHPEISVVLVAEPTPTLWQEALRAGVRDVLAPDAPDSEIRTVVERAAQTASRRRANLVPDGDPYGSSGRIITTVSPKGGSGKTLLSVNLAVGLAQAAPEQVVIVDLDLLFGDVASGLGLAPEHTIYDAAAAPPPLDAMTLKVYLTGHPSGVYALCAPDAPVQGEQVTSTHVSEILALLASEFRYVVVDTPAGLTEHTLSALEAATDIVLLASMDVPSVRNLGKEIEVLDQIGLTGARRHVVLNRADSRVGLETSDIEATLGLPVDAALPSSRSVPLSVNQGTPLMHTDPRSPVARGIAGFAERFVPAPAAQRSGLLSWLKAAR